MAAGYGEGIIVRPLANQIAMSPPLVFTEANVEEFVGGLTRAIATVTDEIVRNGEHKAA